jgi:hypothetical protein
VTDVLYGSSLMILYAFTLYCILVNSVLLSGLEWCLRYAMLGARQCSPCTMFTILGSESTVFTKVSSIV